MQRPDIVCGFNCNLATWRWERCAPRLQVLASRLQLVAATYFSPEGLRLISDRSFPTALPVAAMLYPCPDSSSRPGSGLSRKAHQPLLTRSIAPGPLPKTSEAVMLSQCQSLLRWVRDWTVQSLLLLCCIVLSAHHSTNGPFQRLWPSQHSFC